MKQKILLLLALPVIGYLGVKLYLHNQIRNAVDVVVAELSPFAEIDYESVGSSLDGRVGVSNITIRPRYVDDEIRIQEISFKFPTMMYLLDLESRMRSQSPPEALSMKVHDIMVSFRGELMQALEEEIFKDDPEARLAAFDNCVTRTNLPTQMYLLEYYEIRSNFELGYYHDVTQGHLVVHATAGQIDAYEIAVDLAVLMPTLDSVAMSAAFKNPEIARASLEITDFGYFERVFEYCATHDQLSNQEVIGLLAEELLEVFDDLPMKPDQAMMDAFNQFVSDGSKITVTAQPREPQNLQYLSLYAPEDVPALLNIQTRVQADRKH